MGVTLARCTEEDFDAAVRFAVRLNGRPEHHIGFFGASEGDIRQTLAGMEPPLAEGFVAAMEEGEMVGLMGVEFDREIGRTWLFGPLVDHPDWQTIAGALYAAVQSLLPDGINEHDLFCDVRNRGCRDFAARHGFSLYKEAVILSLPRTAFSRVPALDAEPFTEDHFTQLEALHDTLFPHTYYTARQMVQRQNDATHLLLATQGRELQGYIFCKASPEAGEGYVDFLGVAAPYRRQGVGRRLLAAAVRRMAAHPEVVAINLTMEESNTAAVGLYTGMGFLRERSMISFRRQLA